MGGENLPEGRLRVEYFLRAKKVVVDPRHGRLAIVGRTDGRPLGDYDRRPIPSSRSCAHRSLRCAEVAFVIDC